MDLQTGQKENLCKKKKEKKNEKMDKQVIVGTQVVQAEYVTKTTKTDHIVIQRDLWTNLD